MTRERIDNLADARRLSDEYHRPKVRTVHTDDQVGRRPVHGVAGTGMNGVEAQLDQLLATEKRLTELHFDLDDQLRLATTLTDRLKDGSGPVANRMRQAFVRRADAEGGVQTALREYIEELYHVRIAILQTLQSYQLVDGEAVAVLTRQLKDFTAGAGR